MRKFALLAGLLVLSGAASAGTVNLFDLPGNQEQGGFPGNSQYVQTVTATDLFWNHLAVRVTNASGAGTFALQIYGTRAVASLPGTGRAPDATNLLYQNILTHRSRGTQTFTMRPEISVTPGTVYALVFNYYLDNLGTTPGTIGTTGTVRSTAFNGTDRYLAGEFLFRSGGAFTNASGWTSRFANKQDLAFQAEFLAAAPVPGPASVAGLLTGLVAMAGLARRRRA